MIAFVISSSSERRKGKKLPRCSQTSNPTTTYHILLPTYHQTANQRSEDNNNAMHDGKYKIKGNQPPSVKPSRVPTAMGHVNHPAPAGIKSERNKRNEMIKKKSRKRQDVKVRRGKGKQ